MKMVNIQAAKTHLSRLVDEAATGEEIVLAKAGRPMVRLIPYVATEETRKLGTLRGQIKESEGCWDADPELEKAFSESPVVPRRPSRKPARLKR
jgi:prevent-host-death family protein